VAVATMKVRRIDLQNFRNFELASFDLGDRVAIVGPNGVGKSTLVDAVAWCLTGRCRGVDGRGVGQKDLIRSGADDMEVTLDVDGLGTVTRTLSRHGSMISSVKTDVILAKLGVSEAMLHAVLYGRTFFQLHHGDAKAMLMALLNVQVAPEDLPGLDVKRPLGLDQLEAMYQREYEQRAALKKTVAAVGIPEAPEPADGLDLGVDMVALKADLHQATKDYQAAARIHATADAAVTTQTEALKAATEALAGRGELQGQLTAHQAMLTDATASRDDATAIVAEVEAEQSEPLDDLKGQVADLRLLTDKLERHEPERGCVLSGAIPCMTAAKAFTGHVSKLAGEVKALERRIKAGAMRHERLTTEQQRLKDAKRQVEYHQTQVTQLTDKLAALDVLAAERATLQQQLDAAVASAAAAAEPVAAAEQAMDGLQQRVSDLVGYQTSLAAYQAAMAKAADLQAQLDEAERRVALLGPKGVRGKALQQALGEFQDMVNAALAPFGFDLAIQVEPWQVMVGRPGLAEPMRFDLLSAGEQLWTGLAFQVALAMASGLRWCALDAAEAVVGQRRAILTQLVMAAPVDQVLVGIAKGETEPVPSVAGLDVIKLAPNPVPVAV
jgi:DNA repair exonuclease SbcCD ATPase subunit